MMIDYAARFNAYVDPFLTGKHDFDRNVELKRFHTAQVVDFARQLADAEHFSPQLRQLTLLSAQFHDLARFEQLRQFNTFHDRVSFDHGDYGAKLLREGTWLAAEPKATQDAIIEVVRLHNKSAVPDGLSPLIRQALLAVRDADKIDIFRIMLAFYANHKPGDNPVITLDLPPGDHVCEPVLNALLAHRTPKYDDARSICDFIAIKASWLEDLNFNYTRRCAVERGYFRTILQNLPTGQPQLQCWATQLQQKWQNCLALSEAQLAINNHC